MYPHVIADYISWSERGYLEKNIVQCPKCNIWLLPTVEPFALVLICVLCSYKKDLGIAEYNRIERACEGAKSLFNRGV